MVVICYYVGVWFFEIVIYNGIVYLVGQIVEDIMQDICGQMCEVFGYIDCLFVEVNSDKVYLLLVQIYILDFVNFEGMNVEWDVWVVLGNMLLCVIVEVKFVDLVLFVEIVVVVVQWS